eukprot:10601848-Alexandrium_andersonii.AAC.1
MSASLVGSEMCIRDRRGATPRGPSRSRPRTPETRLCGGRFGASARRCGCLLYTSDAPTICSV